MMGGIYQRQPLAISACLYEDERLGCWLDRVAENNGLKRLRDLLENEPISFTAQRELDFDIKVPDPLKDILAQVTRVSREQITRQEMLGQWMMGGKKRNALCLDCWVDDTRLGRQRYWRRRWIDPLCVSCYRHRMPLIELDESEPGYFELLDRRTKLNSLASKRHQGKGSVLKALLAFENFLHALPEGVDRRSVNQLFDLLARWVDRHVGPWDALRIREKLALFQFSARDSVSWSQLFGPFRPQGRYQKHLWQGLSEVGALGYRRQLIYHSLDVLASWYQYGEWGVTRVLSGRHARLSTMLNRPPVFEAAIAVGAVAETVMPSRCFDGLQRLSRKQAPGGRS